MIYLKNSVGIEIRQEDLVITCLSSNFSGGVFTHFARIAGYRTRERAEVRAEIEQFFRSRRLGRDNVVLGIPRSDVTIRHLDLPREVEENLTQVVLYQVQSFEPTEEGEFYHDYVLMNPKRPGERLIVLLVMIRKTVLDAHLALLGELGLAPSSVTLGSVALANLFLQGRVEPTGKTYILADLRPNGIELAALRDGALVYTREVARAPEEPWKGPLLAEVDLAAGKMRLGPEDTVEALVLAGEGAAEAQEEIREEIQDCQRIGAHVELEMAAAERARLDEGAASLGLAYSGIARRPRLALNLLPAELRFQQTRWAYVPSIILGVVVLGLIGGFAFRPMIQEQIMVRRLDAELAGLKGQVEHARTLKSEVDSLEKKVKFLEELVRPCDMNLELLQELTVLMPQDTFLSLYANRSGTIQLTGSSSSVPDLQQKLEKSPLMKDVQQRGTVFKDAQTGKDRFNLEAKLERCR
jgi:Tfp pilus assembly protein PilN